MRATTIFTKGDIARFRVTRQRLKCRMAELDLERERVLWKLELVRQQIAANKDHENRDDFDPQI
jgi:hypothetical protein